MISVTHDKTVYVERGFRGHRQRLKEMRVDNLANKQERTY